MHPPLNPRAAAWLAGELGHPLPWWNPWDVQALPLTSYKGYFFMPAPQPAPVSAFNDATAKLADAMAGAMTELQTAMTTVDKPAVEHAIADLNNLIGELKQSVTGASGSPAKGATVTPQSEPGKIATPDPLPLTSPFVPPKVEPAQSAA
jgi:hypothetical protein